MIASLHLLLGAQLIAVESAGSRVTCNPAPTDTDEDYILHVQDLGVVDGILAPEGWVFGGSEIPPDANYTAPDEWFASYTFGHVNLIITASEAFYTRFVAATHVAKRLNLMHKPDRIALFQAVLYGRIWCEQAEVTELSEAA